MAVNNCVLLRHANLKVKSNDAKHAISATNYEAKGHQQMLTLTLMIICNQ
jgi:hypothetical protein